MKCKQCNCEIIKIDTMHGNMVCNATAVLYWLSDNPNIGILTPNGETICCVLKGNPEKAHGIGYIMHTCFQEAQL
jgi:hypothetical protein